MSKERRVVLLLLALVMAFTYLVYYTVMANEVDVEEMVVEGALLDLSNWDEYSKSAEISGQWLYYDNILYDEIADQTPIVVDIPENKKREISDNYYRFGTYTMILEGLKPNHMYGIFSGSQVTAYNLYVNDKKVLSNGQVGKSAKTHISQWKHTSGNFYTDANGQARIAVEISNYTYEDGLFWNCQIIGDPENIFDMHVNMILVNVILAIVFISIAIVLLIAYIRFKQEASTLYFILLLFNMTLRLMVTSNKPILLLKDNIPWSFIIRTDYLTGYLYLPIFALFFLEIANFRYMGFVRKASTFYTVFVVTFVYIVNHDVYGAVYMPYLTVLGLFLLFIGYQLIKNQSSDLFHRIIMVMVIVSTMIALLNQFRVSNASYLPVAMLNAIIALTVIETIKIISNLRKKDMLAFRAMIDPLTGLYNRHYIPELANETDLKDLNKYYILFMDLDGFKPINDLYGHDVGDHMLRVVSQRLRACLRGTDTLIRYGGDEFIIIARSIDSEEVKSLAKDIIDRVSTKMSFEENEHQVGISIGISQCHALDYEGVQRCIRYSDEAMYRAKNNGGCTYEFWKVAIVE